MKNIILIGMPGAGKSTVGVVLAKMLGYRFMDSDLVIQEKTGKLLSELIEENGDAGFIQIENDINKAIEVEKTVIATGGSAVYGKEAMEHFKETGIVVYLSVPFDEISERVGNLHKRGVVANGKSTIEEIFDERVSLYEKYADVVIDADEASVREVAVKILSCKELENKL